ncbi:8864_t:CDS:2, partial [Gigaspora rosea]
MKEKNFILNDDPNFKESLKHDLRESLKKILKEDNKDFDMEHLIYIICAILDSESLLFIDNISRDYINKIKSRMKEIYDFPDDKTKERNEKIDKEIKNFKIFIKIKVFIEVFLKNIPLIIIMVIYTSEIVIISYMPIMALITSCMKLLACSYHLYYHPKQLKH